MVNPLAWFAEIEPLLAELAATIPFIGELGALGAIAFLASQGGIDVRNPQSFLRDLVSGNVAASEAIGHPLVEAFVKAPLGLTGVPTDAGTTAAYSMLARAMGYGLVTPMAVGALGSVLKLALGGRAPEHALEHLAKIPEELGTPFMLGEILHDLFFTAIGPSLEEEINKRWHPRRIDVQTARLLLRQHKISLSTWHVLADKLGYDDETRGYLEMLTDQPLVIGELQALYQYGILSEGQVEQRLAALGYRDEDIPLIIALYLKKTETVGGDYYRGVARSAFLDHIITESQFRTIMAQVNVPQASIDLEVAGVNLEEEIKKKTLSVTDLHNAFKAGVNSEASTRTALINAGYDAGEAQTLIQTWVAEDAPKLKGISEALVLKYFNSGVLTRERAFQMLQEDALRAEDINFLLDNPEAGPIHVKEPYNQGTIIQAFKENVITIDDAFNRLRAMGVPTPEATLAIRVASAQLINHAPKKKKTPTLTLAEVQEAAKLGVVSYAFLNTWLLRQGYDESDAAIITVTQSTKDTGSLPPSWLAL